MQSVDPATVRDFLVIIFALLGGATLAINLVIKLKGKPPCEWGRLKLEKVETEIAKLSAYYDNRCTGLKDALDKHRSASEMSLGKVINEFRSEMREMRQELRADFRRLEERSGAGDLGLKELNKDLINALSDIKELTRELAKGQVRNG
jgi:hypothetical protein